MCSDQSFLTKTTGSFTSKKSKFWQNIYFSMYDNKMVCKRDIYETKPDFRQTKETTARHDTLTRHV